MTRALVVEESLEHNLPADWKHRLICSRSHSLRTLGRTTISEYFFHEEEMMDAGSVLASHLKEPRYYAHIVSDDKMIVCFPGILAILTRDSRRAEFERCRAIGELFEIPAEEMQFESMFDEDHPDKE